MAEVVSVGLVSRLVAPDAEIAAVPSVPVPVFVVRISAAPLVVAVGVCDGLTPIAIVGVVPAVTFHKIEHCHAQDLATLGRVHEQIFVALVDKPMSDVTAQAFPAFNKLVLVPRVKSKYSVAPEEPFGPTVMPGVPFPLAD